MRTYIFLILLLQSTFCFAFKGKVVDTSNEPIIAATISVYTNDSVMQANAITDTLGIYNLSNIQYPAKIVFRHLLYTEKTIYLTEEPKEMLNTLLEEKSNLLNEVTINAELVKHYENHTSYKMLQKDMANYSSFVQSMNVIPHMNITSKGSISYKGDSNVVLLLNGVATTHEELQSLSKEDISKVDVYENPPAQYALNGASYVLNVITKRNITGGNIALYALDSFHPVDGNNNVSMFYNHGNNRFSLTYNNEIKRYKKYRTDETLSYTFDDVEYSKRKTGKDSPFNRDNNTFNLGFMNGMADKYQFNVNLSASIHEEKKDLYQDIEYHDGSLCEGLRNSYNKYNKYAANLYFSRNWKNGKNLLFDITGTKYDTQYRSSYKEQTAGQDIFNSLSAYTTDKYSVLSTLQYKFKSLGGTFTIGLNDAYQNSQQKDTDEETIKLSQNTLYGYFQFSKKLGKLQYQLIAAAKYLNVNKDGTEVYNRIKPTPRFNISYRPTSKSFFRLQYSCMTTEPSVSLLSETEQWLDNYYVYRGNGNLKPYSAHQFTLSSSYTDKHYDFSALLLYKYAPDEIVNNFSYTKSYILQSYENLKYKNEYGGQISMNVYPLSNKALKFSATGIYMHFHGKERTGSKWNGYRYQLMLSANYTAKKWEIGAFYQYPGQTVEGQLEMPRAEYLCLDFSYKPIENLSMGIEWNQPFFHAFKEGEKTTERAILQSNIENLIHDYKNMVQFKLSYNLSFGRQWKGGTQKKRNEDNDSGVLVK